MPNLIQKYIEGLKVSDRILEEMVKSRRSLDTTFKPTFDRIFIFDKECKYLFVNFMAAYEMGVNREDAEGQHWRQIHKTSEVMEQVEELVKLVFDVEEVVVKKISFKDPRTLEMRYYEATFSPLYNSQGECNAVYNISKEITERVNVEERLFYQTQLISQLIEKAPQAIIMIDRKGKIIYCNSDGTQLLGSSVEEMVGKSILFISDKLGVCLEKLALYRTVKKKEVIKEQQKVFGKDLIVNSFPLLNKEGEVLGAASIIMDISQTLAIQGELRNLDRLNLVGQIASGVAHEIRNPLTVIKGYLQFLGRKVTNGVDQQFEVILEEVARIEEIISIFLGIAGDAKVKRELHSLNQIFFDVLPLIRADAIKHNIEVCMEAAAEMPQILLNDKELKQVILNLTRNAIEAMQDQGLLSIRTLDEPNKVLFVITDSGVGISKDEIYNIFNPFYTTKHGGAGLGLAICENIVRKYKGKIEVFSEKGNGASFVVCFPKVREG